MQPEIASHDVYFIKLFANQLTNVHLAQTNLSCIHTQTPTNQTNADLRVTDIFVQSNQLDLSTQPLTKLQHHIYGI